MKLSVTVTLDIPYNVWQKYKGKRKGSTAYTDLVVRGTLGVNQAVADELNVPVDRVELVTDEEDK